MIAYLIVYGGGAAATGLVLGVIWHMGRNARRARRAELRRAELIKATTPQIPGLPVDGTPLSHQEQEELAGLLVRLPEHLQNAWEQR